MEKQIGNIITYSNILELTKRIVKEVGFEFQSTLDDATVDEIVSSIVLSHFAEVTKAKGAN